MEEQLRDRVVKDPQICGGRPCIRGTRIPISLILGFLAAGETIEQIIDAYPHLSEQDIRGALAYAAELSQEGAVKA